MHWQMEVQMKVETVMKMRRSGGGDEEEVCGDGGGDGGYSNLGPPFNVCVLGFHLQRIGLYRQKKSMCD